MLAFTRPTRIRHLVLGICISLLSLACIARTAHGQSCVADPPLHVHLEASLPTPGRASGVALTASHAYIADAEEGLQIADISNPAFPTIVGAIDTPGNASDVALTASHAYVADGTAGVQVIDISDPTSPAIVTTVDTPVDAQAVGVSGDYAYVADGLLGSVHVIDVSIPSSAQIVHSFTTTVYPRDLEVTGQHLFVADVSGLLVVDVTNPLALTLVGSYATSTEFVTTVGDYAYVVTDDDLFQVIDISNPTSPTLASSFDLGGDQYWGLAVQAAHAFVAAQLGLVVVDVTDPTSPGLVGIVHVANTQEGAGRGPSVALAGSHAFRVAGDLDVIDISTPFSPPPVGVIGVSGCGDVALSGDKACIAAGPDGGLQVVDVSNPAAPALLGGVATPGDARAIATTGTFACVADGAEGLQIINLANPSSPLVVGNVPVSGYAVDVATSGRYAYVLDASRLDIVDLANPWSPTVVGSLLRGTAIEDHEVSWNSVSVREPYAYIISGSWLTVVDVSNPATPVIVSSLSQGDTDSDVALEGDFAYEIDGSHGHFTVTDISNPSNPTVASKMFFTFFEATSVAVQGSYAYITSMGNRGLSVLDVSDPASPVLAWSAVLPDHGCGIAVAGDFVYASTSQGSSVWSLQVLPAGCNTATAVADGHERTAQPPLVSVWPNPFRAETTIRYGAPRRTVTQLRVYDVLGRRVREILIDTESTGFGTVTWDGTDDRGRRVASGIYVVRLSTPGRSATKRVVLLR